MPRINITEHSDTYSFQVRNNNYATVALPITAIWGPAYVADNDDANPDWLHFAAGYEGTTRFMDTFKGPNTYLGQREKSYDYALKLLAAGYDILVKRVDGFGATAFDFNSIVSQSGEQPEVRINVTAKYAGTYGDNIRVSITFDKISKLGTVQVFEETATNPRRLLEVVNVTFDSVKATDSLPLITEATFSYIENIQFATAAGTIVDPSIISQTTKASPITFTLHGASDYTTKTIAVGTSTGGADITAAEISRLVHARLTTCTYSNYIDFLTSDESQLVRLYNQQILYNVFIECMKELTDPICYDWDVLFSAIADDQYIPKSYIDSLDVPVADLTYTVSTVTKQMYEVAAKSKCGCAFIGTPFNMPRGALLPAGTYTGALKYKNDCAAAAETVGTMYSTFAEVVGPWCKTTLPINGADTWVTPELAHLLLIINADGIGGINKWWMVPAGMSSTGVVHTPEYKIKKAYLDLIQNHDEGVCLNPLMEVPGKGFTCFGNSTLWNKPLGTYNALQNLSTRLLCNRVKQRIWDVALQILFKYNNENAYSHFYAGLSPLLDEMRSVGALTGNEYNPLGYKIIMNPDIINLDRINANTVIGKVYLAVTGVIDTVNVDLFLLPPTGFMESYD